MHVSPNNYGTTQNSVQQNVNYSRGSGFSANRYRSNPNYFVGNNSGFHMRDSNPLGHLGASQAHDNNGRDIREIIIPSRAVTDTCKMVYIIGMVVQTPHIEASTNLDSLETAIVGRSGETPETSTY